MISFNCFPCLTVSLRHSINSIDPSSPHHDLHQPPETNILQGFPMFLPMANHWLPILLLSERGYTRYLGHMKHELGTLKRILRVLWAPSFPSTSSVTWGARIVANAAGALFLVCKWSCFSPFPAVFSMSAGDVSWFLSPSPVSGLK